MGTAANYAHMSNEELIEAYDGSLTTAGKGWLRNELLRRLSAGNPQAEKVQISDSGRYAPCGCPSCPNVRYDYGQLKPERSDGRISDMRIGDYLDKLAGGSGEQRETRIHGEMVPGFDNGWRDELYRERNESRKHTCGCHGWNDVTTCCSLCSEAQRSAGRIKAGSEQPVAWRRDEAELVKAGYPPNKARELAQMVGARQDSENGAVARDGEKIKP